MPSRSTALVVQLLRRLFICRHGHAYMLHLGPDVVWLECTGAACPFASSTGMSARPRRGCHRDGH